MSVQSIRVAGHFGELLQGRIGQDGPVALVTLPCAALGVSASFVPGQSFAISKASAAIMPEDRAIKLLDLLALTLCGCVSFVAEMPPGGGAGVSTAALVALARLAGWQGAAMDLARACVAVEGASDPLMLPLPSQTLWASRRGAMLASMAAPPAMEIIGGFYGPPRRTDPRDMDFPDIADLIPQWQAACAGGDLPRVAGLASLSASRTLAQRAAHNGAQSDPTLSLATGLGALGHVIAHTGAARGLIFAPGTVPADAGQKLQQAGLRGIVQFRAGGGL